MTMRYAIINSEGQCINICLWDGISEWQPPEGCTAIPDPDNLYDIYQDPPPQNSTTSLQDLTPEQIDALLALVKQINLAQ